MQNMAIIEINDISDARLAPYVSLTESQLRSGNDGGIIIVESPKVINTALDNGLQPISLLCEKKHITGDAASIISRIPDLPVFTGRRETLASLTGYTLTRGVLCAMRRPALPSPYQLLAGSRRVCVIYDVCDSTNIGVIFRTAAALGFDAVVVTPQSCDPFGRRSIRVSMGAVFQIPWCFDSNVLGSLRANDIKTVCMALTDRSIFLQDFKTDPAEKYAVILGSEGYGLPKSVISASDFTVKIPMHHGVDSLNVGAAAAIALYQFRP